MRNLEFRGEIYGEKLTLKQIQKRTAKKLFEAGERLFIQSSNFYPFGIWSNAHEINNKEESEFEAIVNNFEYYNCPNSETGTYSSFYKVEKP